MTIEERNEIYEQYERYIDTVFRIEVNKHKSRGIFVSPEDEKDLKQRVLVKLLKYLPRFNPQKSSIKTYLYTIVKTHVKWILIEMKGGDGKPLTKEARNNRLISYDDDGNDFDDWAVDRSYDDAYLNLEPQQAIYCKAIINGDTHRQALMSAGLNPSEGSAFLDTLRNNLKGLPPPDEN